MLAVMMRSLLFGDGKTMSTSRARLLALVMLDDLQQCGALIDPKVLDAASQRMEPARYDVLQQGRYMQTGERD